MKDKIKKHTNINIISCYLPTQYAFYPSVLTESVYNNRSLPFFLKSSNGPRQKTTFPNIVCI